MGLLLCCMQACKPLGIRVEFAACQVFFVTAGLLFVSLIGRACALYMVPCAVAVIVLFVGTIAQLYLYNVA